VADRDLLTQHLARAGGVEFVLAFDIALGFLGQAALAGLQAIGAFSAAVQAPGVGDDLLDMRQAHLLQQPPRQARALGG